MAWCGRCCSERGPSPSHFVTPPVLGRGLERAQEHLHALVAAQLRPACTRGARRCESTRHQRRRLAPASRPGRFGRRATGWGGGKRRDYRGLGWGSARAARAVDVAQELVERQVRAHLGGARTLGREHGQRTERGLGRGAATCAVLYALLCFLLCDLPCSAVLRCALLCCAALGRALSAGRPAGSALSASRHAPASAAGPSTTLA